MAQVLTNNVGLAFTIESSLGVLPGTPLWQKLEPNGISTYGAETTTVERTPISQDRGRRASIVTDLDSSVEFESDLTMDAFSNFIEGFMFVEFRNVEFNLKASSGTVPPPAASSTTFTIDSVSTLLAAKGQFVGSAAISLLYGNGYVNAGNNGLHALTIDMVATDVIVTVAGSTLVTETPPTSASLELCGMRSDDCTFTVSGATATLVSAADLDFTTMGLLAGQYIHLGSSTTAGAVQNAMQDSVANDTFGYTRITAVSATTLNLDKLDVNLGSGGSPYTPGTLDIMYGRYLRNVAVTTDVDDARYLTRSYQFEAAYPDLGGAGTDEYEYAIGNLANEITIDVPLADKAGVTFGFIGTNTDDITPSRKTGAATAQGVGRDIGISSSNDMASLSTDLISVVGDVCFKSLSLTLNNGISPEKCLGTQGASFMNTGQFEVNLDAQMMFTNKQITNAVKNNTTITLALILKNENGAIALDIPSMKVSGGDKEYPVNESVLANLTGTAFNDATLGTSLGISLFPTVPTVRP